MAALCIHRDAQTKTCPRCSSPFSCGKTADGKRCWCNDYPPIFPPDPSLDCLCPSCLLEAMKEKINQYVSEMTPEKALTDNKAKALRPSEKLVEGLDFYWENGLCVFTAWHHLRRGHCCTNGCRHCPYGYKREG